MSAFFEVELEAEGAADAEVLAVVDFLAGVFAFPVFFIFFAGFWLVQKQFQSLQRTTIQFTQDPKNAFFSDQKRFLLFLTKQISVNFTPQRHGRHFHLALPSKS